MTAFDDKEIARRLSSLQYDGEREKERKEYVEQLFSRSPAQIVEEEAMYVEAKRMQANEKTWRTEREALIRTLSGMDAQHMYTMEKVHIFNSTPIA